MRTLIMALFTGIVLALAATLPADAAVANHGHIKAPAPLPVAGRMAPSGFVSVASLTIAQRRACSPIADGDGVHVSSGDASGHGWWKLGNCHASKATVSIVLQEFINGGWRNRGQGGQKTVFAGGGSCCRATARATCLTSATTNWRSHVDVSVVGESGTASHTTPSVSRACRVP